MLTELRDSAVFKAKIISFGPNLEKVKRNYPNAKVLLFAD
jgi:hypothetical protein